MIHRKGLEDHLYIYDLKPDDTIKGYNVSYRELDNMLSMLRDEGWSGLSHADEALQWIIIESNILEQRISDLENEVAGLLKDLNEKNRS